ncbi:hypothetical protein [Thiolapillus sp.]|uniref:hypothetical protein n=1 Tax=Thiolapillus sp. TaxID=2017437 RepID=UPI003AF7F53D
MRTTGKQCGLAATGVYQPSLRSPWLAADESPLVSAFHQPQHTSRPHRTACAQCGLKIQRIVLSACCQRIS